ncbi:MAG: hypothetical protein HYV67_00560 [Candidatus Taylorbacteria bacterium]|nr:hypothetical protein [Candidatus Taylorbacteria bacterium]
MIELATSAMILFSLFYGGTAANVKPIDNQLSVKVAEDKNIVDGMALFAPAGDNKVIVEMVVRDYFKGTPILAEIAKCESQFRHIGERGDIIRGKVNPSDIGVMQINEDYHSKEALKLGLDLTTLQGNMAFAKRLYEKEGTAPWQSSSECWDKNKS